MPIATPEVYAQMLDTAKQQGFAFPAINVTSTQTLNAALKGFADAAHRVGGVRPAELGQRAQDDDQGEVKVPLVGQHPGEAERDLGRDRDARRLQEAEQDEG